MAYLFRYAGDDRQRPTPRLMPTQRVKKTRKPKVKPIDLFVPSPPAGEETQVDAFARFIPPPGCGLPPSYRKILQAVCEKHAVPYANILGTMRDKRTSQARRDFLFRCMEELPRASYSAVGRWVNLDHSTVLYAHRKGQTDPSSLEPIPGRTRAPTGAHRASVVFSDKQETIIARINEGSSREEIAAELGKDGKWITNQLYEIRNKIARMDADARAACGLPAMFGYVGWSRWPAKKNEEVADGQAEHAS